MSQGLACRCLPHCAKEALARGACPGPLHGGVAARRHAAPPSALSRCGRRYRSIRVLPHLDTLGEWLERHGMPVYKGAPRRVRARGRALAGAADGDGAYARDGTHSLQLGGGAKRAPVKGAEGGALRGASPRIESDHSQATGGADTEGESEGADPAYEPSARARAAVAAAAAAKRRAGGEAEGAGARGARARVAEGSPRGAAAAEDVLDGLEALMTLRGGAHAAQEAARAAPPPPPPPSQAALLRQLLAAQHGAERAEPAPAAHLRAALGPGAAAAAAAAGSEDVLSVLRDHLERPGATGPSPRPAQPQAQPSEPRGVSVSAALLQVRRPHCDRAHAMASSRACLWAVRPPRNRLRVQRDAGAGRAGCRAMRSAAHATRRACGRT
jgi:hypothetical protein